MRALPANSVIASDQAPQAWNLRRLQVFAGVATAEIFIVSFLFDFNPHQAGHPYWYEPLFVANTLAKIAVVAFATLLLVAWPRRQEILEAQCAAASNSKLKYYVAGNIGLFSVLLFTGFLLSRTAQLPFYGLMAYACLLLATGASLALLAAPPSAWRRLLTAAPTEIALALAVGCVAVGAGRAAQESWHSLSSATLWLSHWFLNLYEPTTSLDSEQRIIAVGNFAVQVWDSCSGYEGLALVATVLPIYFWAFRRHLRFPHVLLLLPIGMAAIWTLNALRIAVLVSIGSHVSPEIALQGFHSQAGWIGFLIVMLTIVAASRRIAFFSALPVHNSRCPTKPVPMSGAQSSLEFLAPFIALVAASILASAFAPHDQWLYAVKVAAVGATLWWFWGAYRPLLSGASLNSVAIGLAVGIVWIATAPDDLESPLGAWLALLPVWLAVTWLALRAFGSIVLVPIAEELAFRGYLSRVLISTRFESVGFGEFRPLAFIGSTVMFGIMHQRWLAACLAGAVYALLMYRTNRLSDPIAAHMSSNAAIVGWAVVAQKWSLL